MQLCEKTMAAWSARGFTAWLVGVVLLLDLFVVGLAGFILYQSRLQYDQNAAVQAQNLTQALAYSMTGIIDTADVALLAVSDEAERETVAGGIDRTTINRYIIRQHQRLPQIDNIRMANERGDIVYGSAIPAGPVTNIADREFFQRLRDTTSSGLLISKPIIGRLSHKWVVTLGRRLTKRDGSFGGIVYGIISLDRIDNILSAIHVGHRGGLSLRDDQMNIIVRHPVMRSGNPTGIRYITSDLNRRAVSGEGSGTFYEPHSWDNVAKTVSYRNLANYPIYVVVALAAEDYLAPWWRDFYRISCLVAFFVLVTLVLSRLARQRWLREKEAERLLRKAKEELELRVEQRTAELLEANVQLTHELDERERAEERLRQGRNVLAQIIDAIPQSVFWKDRNSVYLGCNLNFARAAGKANADEIVGKTDFDLPWLPDESMAYRRDDREVMENNLPKYHIIEQQFQASGAHVWVDTCKIPLCDGNGEVTGVLGIYDNITERKEIEEARDKALGLFESVLSSSPTGIHVFDGETGDCVTVNDALVEMVGGSRSAVVTHNFRKLASWRATGIYELAEQVLADSITRQIQTSFTTSFGKEVNFNMFLSRCIIDGRPHLMSIYVDITEAKRLEEEKRVIESQMLHAQKLESLGVLAGGIAHDFNNILMVISGNVDLALMRVEGGSPARENLVQIEQATSRAAELAGQMLAYSGKGRFIIESIDLNKIVREMSQMIEVSISKKVALQYNLAADLPAVVGDATQLSQVILNLVINASEAIGDQSGAISIATESMTWDRALLSDFWIDDDLPEGGYVVLDVADTGCGIPPEIIAKIFDPFFTTKFTGRGLGMAAVLGIVRGHKGGIKVSSELGKGTRFRVLLPAVDAPAERLDPEVVAEAAVPGNGTVLLVDDEETIRTLGEDMLQVLGFRPLVAADGREAIEIFRKHKDEIVCVLLDLTMPELDGEQTLQQLRLINPQVRAIVTSGYTEHEVSQRFIGTELVGFLQKPYKLSAVSAKLHEMVG